MQPSIKITTGDQSGESARLFVDAGRQGMSFLVMEDKNLFTTILAYNFDTVFNEAQLAGQIREVLINEPILQQRFEKIDIIWSFNESVLVPHQFYKEEINEALVEMVHGDLVRGRVRSEFMYKHNVHNIYRVPQLIYDVFSTHYPSASHAHQHSLLRDMGTATGNELAVVFYPGLLKLNLVKDGQFQILQSFHYHAAEDAAYHLLNACNSFGILPSATNLILSGMIDNKSALFNEIYKYFLTIELKALPDGFRYPDGIKEQPAHYFSHLFATAVCV